MKRLLGIGLLVILMTMFLPAWAERCIGSMVSWSQKHRRRCSR